MLGKTKAQLPAPAPPPPASLPVASGFGGYRRPATGESLGGRQRCWRREDKMLADHCRCHSPLATRTRHCHSPLQQPPSRAPPYPRLATQRSRRLNTMCIGLFPTLPATRFHGAIHEPCHRKSRSGAITSTCSASQQRRYLEFLEEALELLESPTLDILETGYAFAWSTSTSLRPRCMRKILLIVSRSNPSGPAGA